MKSVVSACDETIRSVWATAENLPIVFIVGLHRSGTTFLYEALSQVLPVAKLTVQNVVFYRTLIASYLRDGGHHDRQWLKAYFQDNNINTRGRDSLPLHLSASARASRPADKAEMSRMVSR